MISLGGKLCGNNRENLVENFVSFKTMCKNADFSQLFNTFSHPLFDNSKLSVLSKGFSHLHTLYYNYYDILKINNYNNRKV